MSTPENLLDLIGRILMSAIFVVVGLQQMLNLEATRAYMDLHGVLSAFLPVAIALELLGAVAIILGYWTRIFAFLLAAFSIATAFLFHDDLANLMELELFLRDIAMAGGMLVLCAHTPGEWSLDARRGTA
jgi:putative oxidoreductase